MSGRRILLVLTEFPPRIGGMQTHALALARHLHGAGYVVEVLTYRANRHEEKNAVAQVDAHLPFSVHRVLSRLGYWHNIRRIVEHSRRFEPAVIYCSTVFYGFVGRELSVPVVCRSVGNDIMRPWIAWPFRFASRLLSNRFLEQPVYDLFKRMNYPEWVEVLFNRFRRQVMVRSARLMRHVMANSEYTADLLRGIGIPDERIEVLVGGVDAARFECRAPRRIRKKLRQELGLPPKCFLLTTACRMVSKKGVDFLLDAMLELRERMPDAHLLLIGDGRHANRYRRMARRMGLEHHVTFAGRVPQQEIQSYYWASNVFVLASRVQINKITGMRDAETMGRVLCEANAAGIPVIASRSGGIPSVVRHKKNGLLFEEGDAAGFIRNVTVLRKDKALERRLVHTGLKWAREKFDWAVIVAAHERLLEKVAGIKRKASARASASASSSKLRTQKPKTEKRRRARKPALART